MRKGYYTLALALLGALALPGSPASAQPYSRQHLGGQVDVGIFYDSLARYGDWVEMPEYGWSWAPRVERGWRPYTRGQWVMTDDGWLWDSDEQFGWAAYHYGRWVNDRYYGWVWIPGTEWAPAWVSWRHGNGYTGWAPLPPRARWQTHVGLSLGGLDIDAFIGADDYSFVQDRAFVDRGIYQRVLPPTRNVTIINVTNNVTNYTVVNQRVVNGGIAVANVEQAVGRRVPRARTVDADRADAPRHARAGEVAVFRPEVKAAPERRPAQGRSLVKGEEPPPQLAERRREREQERRQKGNEPEVTAKDVERQRPGGQGRDRRQDAVAQPETPRAGAPTQQEAQAERNRARQDAEKERVKGQDQQRVDRERQANEQQQRAQGRQDAEKERAKAQADQRANRERQANEQQQQRVQARQDAEKERAKAQDDQRVNRERQANEQQQQQQRVQARQDAERERAKAQDDQRANRERQANEQQQQQQQRVQARQDAERERAKAQDDQRVNRERQANEQQQQQQQRVQGRQDAERERAKGQDDQRANREQRRGKDAPQEAKEAPKDKGKKKPKPEPTPTPKPASEPQQ